MANSRKPAELKNCKLENPSPLFRPLAQYLGSDKRLVLSPGVTNDFLMRIQPSMHASLTEYDAHVVGHCRRVCDISPVHSPQIDEKNVP